MSGAFDPAPFRRAAVLRRLLEEALGRDEDPEAGLGLEEREIREETRRLVAEALPEAPSAEEEDELIRACHARAVRIVARKAKRRAAGKTWGE